MSMAHITSGKGSRQSVGTPDDLVEYLRTQVRIVRDLAAEDGLSICADFFTKEMDALGQDWGVLIVEAAGVRRARRIEADEWQFCNPPYKFLRPWYEKFFEESSPVTGLIPSPKFLTLTPVAMGRSYFRELVEGANCWPRPLVGRLKFKGYDNSAGGDSMLTIWDGEPYREPRTLDWRNQQGLFER